MATDHHVHFTARTPLTTISLGAPAGDGVKGGAGLNLSTTADKTEHIEGSTTESYVGATSIHHSNTKSEWVNGSWKEYCMVDKTEFVNGTWTQTCESERNESAEGVVTQNFMSHHNLFVGKVSTCCYADAKEDKVSGTYRLTVVGDSNRYTGGNENNTYLGKVSTHSLGARHEFTTDVHVTTAKGAKLDSYAGLTATFNETLSVSQSLTSMSLSQTTVSGSIFSISQIAVSVTSGKIVSIFK